MEEFDVAKKAHKASKTGRKAEKKKKVKEEGGKTPRHAQDEESARARNPRAFAIQNVGKTERRVRRKEDVTEKRKRLPTVDRTPTEPPPYVVAIVGPPKVGKSTLLRSLIRNFTKENLSEIKGPITILSGKRRRLTFIECPNQIQSMIDVAKVADLALILIDASFGFEMEVFEFLDICRVHGFPRIMGILTHLDSFKNVKFLRKTKKIMKHRFWTEVYQGAKLFYLSGTIRGEYQRTEVHNLARFISVMKFRPLLWREAHPYVLADRMEDLTDPEVLRTNPKVDRRISIYGYLRGTHLKNKSNIHVPGVGDFSLSDVIFLPDPCPLPEKVGAGKSGKRSLHEKDKCVYAPMSGVGGIVYDKDAVYIDTGHHRKKNRNRSNDDEPIEASMISNEKALDEKMEESHVQLFSNFAPIKFSDLNEDGDTNEVRKRRKVCFDDEKDDANDEDELSDDDEDMEVEDGDSEEENTNYKDNEEEAEEVNDELNTGLNWKGDLAKKASENFYARQAGTNSLRKLVYGQETEDKADDPSDSEEKEEIGGMFKVLRDSQNFKGEKKSFMNQIDSTKFAVTLQDWKLEDVLDSIKDCFVTGKWKDSEDADELLRLDDYDESASDRDMEDSITEEADADQDKPRIVEDAKELHKKRIERKKELKKRFDSDYDDTEGGKSHYEDLKREVEEQTMLNRKEFEGIDDELRIQYEGYRPGMYLRCEVEGVPCELVQNFNPYNPLIIGGLLSGEDQIGCVQLRLKRHRWYPKILKNKDPLILSLGWRRFQTNPILSIQDHNMRHRMIKYTPKHLHCDAHVWGPITPQGNGFLAVQSISETMSNFRIAATGSVVEIDKTVGVVKKLKLTGEPYQIFRKTAFIKGMFNSPLEVAKFEGAGIRTVSGIRGQIKKSLSSPPGAFRATFEDKILKSDIVFVRTWFSVDIPKFYAPVTDLLLPIGTMWKGMRTTGQLKREKQIQNSPDEDSLYTEVQREPKVFGELRIPRNLQKNLPYQAKPKLSTNKTPSLETKRMPILMEPKEKKVCDQMTMLKKVFEAKQEKAAMDTSKRVEELIKRKKIEEQKKFKTQKEARKRVARTLSQAETKKRKMLEKGSKKSRD